MNNRGDLSVVLTGGGARAAYQVGVLATVATHFPQTKFDIITGVSAGAINALFLASSPYSLPDTLHALCEFWENLEIRDIFRVDTLSLFRHVTGWGIRLVSGGSSRPHVRGMVDASPLRYLLTRALPHDAGGVIRGVAENLERCEPRAVAVTTLNYSTGQTITWVDGCDIETWQRPTRRSVRTRLTIDHVMASAALPMFFPAVHLPGGWYGDGGIRLSAPLSPALHLGAERILLVSTSHAESLEEAAEVDTEGYPPPAQILGQLVNSIFLDVIDEDALRLERSNTFLRELSPEERRGFRVVDLLVIRPSVDLAKLAAPYEPRLPRAFRFLMRGLGTRQTTTPELLSLLTFQRDYLREMIAIGKRDAENRLSEISRLVGIREYRALMR